MTETELLNLIKKDSVKGIISIIAEDSAAQNATFGRFTLAAVCKIYNSKKVLKVLQEVVPYSGGAEQYAFPDNREIERQFSDLMGRNARNYIDKTAVDIADFEDNIEIPERKPVSKKLILTISIVAIALVLGGLGTGLGVYFSGVQKAKPVTISTEQALIDAINGTKTSERTVNLSSDITLSANTQLDS
ncbi:MAG: hypothetical protein LBN25_02055, partial [Christensenellaceae bacterium]|nr:hypothetical protein [Christensenellaceae bacterium]